MSVVLVCLPGAPKVSEEAVRKDAELNKYLESRVEGENGGSKCKVSGIIVSVCLFSCCCNFY